MQKLEREYLGVVRRFDRALDLAEKGHRLGRFIFMLDRQLEKYERALGRPRVIRVLRRYGLSREDVRRVVANMDRWGIFQRN